MTELKTLKNIGAVDPIDCFAETIDRKELRQEAIKWIKELKESPNSTETKELLGSNFGSAVDDVNTVVKWIKHFFNIEESELK